MIFIDKKLESVYFRNLSLVEVLFYQYSTNREASQCNTVEDVSS